MKEILRVKNINNYILNNINLDIEEGAITSIIGKSGGGKSTIAKILSKIENFKFGIIELKYKNDYLNIAEISNKNFYSYLQIVFQDPYSSLNPQRKIFESLKVPCKNLLNLKSDECREKCTSMLSLVGLNDIVLDMYPNQLSGGQLQRINIARALIPNPKILILDEPLSALDISVQSQIINLLLELNKTQKITMIFISHDLHVVRHLSDYIYVVDTGSIIEHGKMYDIFHNPIKDLTKLMVDNYNSIKI
ncbi:ABC transporter ATP-binding protein [Acinetobacter seifertii]|uniref:ABC transporter ATP-binding protein n=1 Tax=Acinetobacter seifertii TaxID=1530123 RepID=UPI001F06DF85|nr:ATP-binding cassette domain-containing protein [Acinetobacter seifertii]MCH2000260.1 ATP-binding cassette domain-containing protein [Acinetobacter seifertii]